MPRCKAILSLNFAVIAACQSTSNPFLQPGPGVDAGDYSSASVHVIGSLYTVEWCYISAINMTLRLVVDVTNTEYDLLDYIYPGTVAYNWTVIRPPNTTSNDVFFFSLANTEGLFYDSAYFNITDPTTMAQTVVPTPSSTLMTTTAAFPISTSHGNAATNGSSSNIQGYNITNTGGIEHDNQTNNNPSSTGAQAGIGVGATALAILAIAFLAAGYIWRRERQTRAMARLGLQAQVPGVAQTANSIYLHDRSHKAELLTHEQPQELSSSRPPVELADECWTHT